MKMRNLCFAAGVALLSVAQAGAQGWIYNPMTGNEYKLTSVSGTWQDAQAEAVTEGGDLVSITAAEENQFLVDNFADEFAAHFYYWIGYNDIATEGDFVWSNGDVSSFTNWLGGEPDNQGGSEDCGGIGSGALSSQTGGWTDQQCGSALFGIMERVGTPPVPAISNSSLVVLSGVLVALAALGFGARKLASRSASA